MIDQHDYICVYGARLLQRGFYFIIIQNYIHVNLSAGRIPHIDSYMEPAMIIMRIMCDTDTTRKTISLYYNSNYNRLMTDLLTLYHNILQFFVMETQVYVPLRVYTHHKLIYYNMYDGVCIYIV